MNHSMYCYVNFQESEFLLQSHKIHRNKLSMTYVNNVGNMEVDNLMSKIEE